MEPPLRGLDETKRLLAGHAGYGSVSRFYEKASSRLGMAARDYRAKGRGQSIAFCCFPPPLGSVLVWERLRRIPAGETRTLLVPCHRAVRTDGGLGGYAWGLARKKRLLELERRKEKKR